MAILGTEGQQTPSSLALSASDISTVFCVALMPCNGQQALMIIVLIEDPPG
jgi:hypothetical protein